MALKPAPPLTANDTFLASKMARDPDLHRIRNNHQEIMRRATLGQRNQKIAKDLGLSASRVSTIVNSPLVAAKIDELQELRTNHVAEAKALIAESLDEAVDLLKTVLGRDEQSDVPVPISLRMKAATELLDRGGVPKAVRTEGQTINLTLTGEDIEAIKQRAGALTVPAVEVSNG